MHGLSSRAAEMYVYLEDGRRQRLHTNLAIESIRIERRGKLMLLLLQLQGQRWRRRKLHQRLTPRPLRPSLMRRLRPKCLHCKSHHPLSKNHHHNNTTPSCLSCKPNSSKPTPPSPTSTTSLQQHHYHHHRPFHSEFPLRISGARSMR